MAPSSSSADPGLRLSQDLSSGYSHRLVDQSIYTRGGYVPPPKPSVTPIKKLQQLTKSGGGGQITGYSNSNLAAKNTGIGAAANLIHPQALYNQYDYQRVRPLPTTTTASNPVSHQNPQYFIMHASHDSAYNSIVSGSGEIPSHRGAPPKNLPGMNSGGGAALNQVS